MQKPEPPVIKPFVFVFSWRRFLMHTLILGVCTFLGVMTWFLSKPHSIRFYDTTSGSPIAVALVPGIDMVLDKKSILAIKDDDPIKAELFAGNVFFDVKNHDTNQFELRVGNALIKNIGTRFSVRMQKNGEHQIAVANGKVEIHLAAGVFQVNAFEQASFDEDRLSKRILIQETDVAPWYSRNVLN